MELREVPARSGRRGPGALRADHRSGRRGPAPGHRRGVGPLSPELLARVAAGDRAAFRQLFEEAAPRIKTFLLRRGAPQGQADELTQEILLTVWRTAHRYDPSRASAATWIFTIARNKHVDRVRKRVREVPVEEFRPPEGPRPDACVAAWGEARRVREALQGLPSEQRVILEATFFEFKAQSLIAEELGVPLGTVKSRTRLALNKLRAVLE